MDHPWWWAIGVSFVCLTSVLISASVSAVLHAISCYNGTWLYINWEFFDLAHWGWVTYICISDLIITGSDNDLSPSQHLAIIWTNTEMLWVELLGTNFSEILSGIQTFSFKKMYLKMSSGKCQPLCLGLNVLKHIIMETFIIEIKSKGRPCVLYLWLYLSSWSKMCWFDLL